MTALLSWMHAHRPLGPTLSVLLFCAAIGLVLMVATRPRVGRHAARLWRRPSMPVHKGAHPGWSPKREILAAPPAPRIDPKILLAEAEEELAKAAARVDAYRQAVIDDENARWHAEFARFEAFHTAEIQRVGHLELHTVEVTKDQLAQVLGGGQ